MKASDEKLFRRLAKRIDIIVRDDTSRPEKIGPRYVRNKLGITKCKSITYRLKYKKGGKGLKEWSPFVKFLSKESAELWDQRKLKKLTYKQCVANILAWLRKDKPETFSQKDIRVNCEYEYDKIRHEFRKPGDTEPDWMSFFAGFPKIWSTRFKPAKPRGKTMSIKK